MKWIDRTILKLQYKIDELERELDNKSPTTTISGGFWDFVDEFYEQGKGWGQ